MPQRFNRNSATVTSLMPAEESGRWLLERMRVRLGLEHYDEVRLLDFGCGVRFTQALVNGSLRVGSYAGVDIDREMIEFLKAEVRDRRFQYVFLDAHHPLYNPGGEKLTESTTLPLPEGTFDVVSMFSVVTHLTPADSRMIFRLLRRYVKRTGRLFFTCFLDDGISSFEDRSPARNGGRCHYNRAFLSEIVETSGWRVLDCAPSEGPLIADSLLCEPA